MDKHCLSMVESLPVSDMPVEDPTITKDKQHREQPRLIIVMGVCGCGKSTIASALAKKLNGMYLDADDYHPDTNIAKMRRGEALTDEDRWPWLQQFAENMAQHEGTVVGACSALRHHYRECITQAANESVLFVFADGSKTLIRQRMQARQGHFMPDSLLDSQFAILERPQASEHAISVDISGSVDDIVQTVLIHLTE
ncbi:MAG: gluconokinase [Thiolinea sp.]